MTLATEAPQSAYHDVWRSIEECGFAVIPEIRLGGSALLRDYIRLTYFSPDVLGADHPAVHGDRDRARDVIRYEWAQHGGLHLDEHDTIAITDRGGFEGTRIHPRVKLLEDPLVSPWIARAIAAVPPNLRRHRGTFAINLLRTRTNIVNGPHQDNEDIVLIYVLGKTGGGATTRLFPVDNPAVPCLEATLDPGEVLAFRDELFLHDATPLTSNHGESPQRDTFVCTINYPTTYPLP